VSGRNKNKVQQERRSEIRKRQMRRTIDWHADESCSPRQGKGLTPRISGAATLHSNCDEKTASRPPLHAFVSCSPLVGLAKAVNSMPVYLIPPSTLCVSSCVYLQTKVYAIF
jgi:hypothetical protein